MKRGDVLEGRRLREFADYAGVRITGRVSEDGLWTGYDAGDRILFMEHGEIIESADSDEFFNGTVNDRARRFLDQILH